MYSANSKKLMSGRGIGCRNGTPNPMPVIGADRIVAFRSKFSISR